MKKSFVIFLFQTRFNFNIIVSVASTAAVGGDGQLIWSKEKSFVGRNAESYLPNSTLSANTTGTQWNVSRRY